MQEEPLPETSARILGVLESLNVDTIVQRHAPVFTVAEAQALRGEIPGGHTKNLFLKDRKGRLFLVTALENAQIDLKSLHTQIGGSGRLSFGSAELLQEVLGVQPGAVSPLGLVNDAERRCKLVLDKALMNFEMLNFHPLDNRLTVSVSPTGLDKLLAHTGHEPQFVEF